jgi:hypothetical protein
VTWRLASRSAFKWPAVSLSSLVLSHFDGISPYRVQSNGKWPCKAVCQIPRSRGVLTRAGPGPQSYLPKHLTALPNPSVISIRLSPSLSPSQSSTLCIRLPSPSSHDPPERAPRPDGRTSQQRLRLAPVIYHPHRIHALFLPPRSEMKRLMRNRPLIDISAPLLHLPLSHGLQKSNSSSSQPWAKIPHPLSIDNSSMADTRHYDERKETKAERMSASHKSSGQGPTVGPGRPLGSHATDPICSSQAPSLALLFAGS